MTPVERVKIILIGAGPTALAALESLAGHCKVVAVFRVVGENDSVAALAHNIGVPVIQDMSTTAIDGAIQELLPDCVVISSYNRIVAPQLLELCPFVNVHYSPLPRYRGRANVNWAIINGESYAAISVHTVVAGLDAGNILFQRLVPVDNTATVADVYECLNGIEREYLGRTVCEFIAGFQGTPQPEGEATYCCTRIPADGEIDWKSPSQKIYNLIRALQPPYPYAYTFFQGRQLAIVQAEQLIQPPEFVGRIPGRVVLVDKTEGNVDVLTGDGVLRIRQVVVRAVEPPQSAAVVIRSTKDSLGLHPRELLSRIEQLEQQVKELVAQVAFAAQVTTA